MDLSLFQKTTRGAFAAALFACACAGCTPNPNGMGVADFGSVTGTVVDQRALQPIPNALISVGNLAAKTAADGSFRIGNIPVGTQTVIISAIGYQGTTVTVVVQKDQQTVIDQPIALVSTLGT